MNSVSLLEKGDYTHFRSFVAGYLDFYIFHHSP